MSASSRTNRLLDGFKNGHGLASPALILVWLGLGVGLIWFSLSLGFNAIELHSGTVGTVQTDPQYGTHVTLESSSIDFFFDSGDFDPLPDIKVGDHVDILSAPQPYGWAIAVHSDRGTWVDSIFGDEIAPFSPQTWALHEALRWMTLTLGLLVAVFGGASLVRWVTQKPSRVIEQTSSQSLKSASLSSDPDSPSPGVEQTAPVVQTADRAALGVTVGALTVIVLPIVELFAVIAGLGSCSGYQTKDGVLIAITIAFAGGGITTLALASRGQADSTDRVKARRLGVIAIVMTVASLLVNLFVVGLSGFCAVG